MLALDRAVHPPMTELSDRARQFTDFAFLFGTVYVMGAAGAITAQREQALCDLKEIDKRWENALCVVSGFVAGNEGYFILAAVILVDAWLLYRFFAAHGNVEEAVAPPPAYARAEVARPD